MPRWVAGMIAGVLGQDRINRKLTSSFFGPRLPLKSGYARRLLENCEYNYKLNPDYLSRIPASGPALFVANHPSGIFDGAMLYDVISELRPDVRIVANRFFECLKRTNGFHQDPVRIRAGNATGPDPSLCGISPARAGA
ncbi:hypothetical protein [Roseibium sp.]